MNPPYSNITKAWRKDISFLPTNKRIINFFAFIRPLSRSEWSFCGSMEPFYESFAYICGAKRNRFRRHKTNKAMRTKRGYWILAAVAAVTVAALITADALRGKRADEEPVTVLNGSALGTVYQVSVKGAEPARLRAGLDSLFAAADMSMSIFNPSSLLSCINRGETDIADTNIVYCINLAREVSELSDGAYDITVKPLVDALGFGGREAQKNPDIDSLLQFVGYRKLSTDSLRIVKADPRVQIDLNSIAKGAIVDLAARMVEKQGAKDYLVDIGGEIFCRGTNKRGERWSVGIETPFEGNYSLTGEHITTVVRLSGEGLATSGNYRNFRTDSAGRKFTHIIDPRTGRNTASNLLSATVIAPTCALADAYGTMFVSLGLEKSEKIASDKGIAALFIWADSQGKMRIYTSSAMKPYLK